MQKRVDPKTITNLNSYIRECMLVYLRKFELVCLFQRKTERECMLVYVNLSLYICLSVRTSQ